MNGMPGFVSPFIAQEYHSPCKIVPNPNDFLYCNAPSGTHTVLDVPICDACWDAIRVP